MLGRLFRRSGKSPDSELLAAVMASDARRVSACLFTGADPNASAPNGAPLIVVAATKGADAVVGALLDAGADVNRPTRGYPMTALHAAVAHRYVDVVRVLLAHGSDVDTLMADSGLNALSTAVRQHNEEVVRLLLDAGADPNVTVSLENDPKDNAGMTATIFAASLGLHGILRTLIDHRADLDRRKADGITALMVATRRDDGEAVRLLVAGGANINLRNDLDASNVYGAIDIARAANNAEIAEFLLYQGAVPTRRR